VSTAESITSMAGTWYRQITNCQTPRYIGVIVELQTHDFSLHSSPVSRVA